eukprot:7927181-Alexandrium_andersonii.AAC.1
MGQGPAFRRLRSPGRGSGADERLVPGPFRRPADSGGDPMGRSSRAGLEWWALQDAREPHQVPRD